MTQIPWGSIESVSLPPVYRCRPATRADAEALEELVNRTSERDVGLLVYAQGELAQDWAEDDTSGSHLLVVTPEESLAAAVWTEPEEGGIFAELLVAPGREELLPAVLDLAEAGARAAAAASGERLTLTINVAFAEARRSLDERGYARGVEDIAMFMDLGGLSGAPSRSEGVQLRAYREDEDDALMWRMMRAGFGEDWDGPATQGEWIAAHRGAPGYSADLWFFAEVDGEVAGAIQCRERWRGSSDTGWIKNLSVVPAARTRGVGRALIEEAFYRFRTRGLRRAVLGVMAANPTRAKDFYLRVGMYEGGGSTDHLLEVFPDGTKAPG